MHGQNPIILCTDKIFIMLKLDQRKLNLEKSGYYTKKIHLVTNENFNFRFNSNVIEDDDFKELLLNATLMNNTNS